MRSTRHRASRAVIFCLLLVIGIVAVYPLLYMVTGSMKTSLEFVRHPAAWPEGWYIDNYKALFYRFSLLRLFTNTFICVLGAFLLTHAVTIPASYAFAKLRFRSRLALYTVMIATMAIPGITFIIPNFLLMSRMGLVDHFGSVILMWSVGAVPGNVFLMTSLMRGMPDEMLQAVKIDGASYVQLMLRIVIPISLPGIVTLSIFNTTSWYNDLMTPLIYLQSDQMKTMTVAVATILGRFDSDYPLLLSGLVLVSLPPVLIYLLLQGYIRKGLVVGSIK
ncbi:carbohydrate ABC transporter permease [Paenibacillus cymbidii]|uniref:carbohydrate ABC transporter permease n=1 Tax=Paenibacillus cymbidii TaxID=1639034 RepID=UPI001080A684|nr:carbohydrate ABC transporter permease [Paenibacillus cymbidii]